LRIAALAFGVIAGLIASLILALGGLDVGSALAAGGERQVSLIRFGLFVVANLGVFGAALVLAAPLAGAILLVLGALSWVAAALILHHTTDLVLIVPPALLLIATAFAVVAYIRRPHQLTAEEEEAAARDAALSGDPRAAPEPEDFEELPPVSVGAGFFGQGGTAQPLGTQHERPQPNLRGLDERDQISSSGGETWQPGQRRKPPPRQKSMFRQPDDDDEDDEEEASGLSRFAFGLSGVLSFGLYAALAGAAVLIFLNLRGGEAGHPAAAKIEPSVSSAAVADASSSSQPGQAPVLTANTTSSALPSLPPPSAASGAGDGTTSSRLPLQPGLDFESSAEPATQSSEAAASSNDQSPDTATPTDTGASSAEIVPFTMTSEMAAARQQPAPKPTRSSPGNTVDTGL